MSTPSLASLGKIVILFMIAVAICAFVVILRRSAIPFGSFEVQASTTPTHAPFHGQVELIKPTYTPVPTITATPVELAATVESLVNADILVDASAPDSAMSSSGELPGAEPAYTGNKSVVVDISEQHMYVYEGDAVIYSFIASTGINNGTRVGSFNVLDKIPNAYGATWDLWMPNWLGIYWSGSLENGIHALPILSGGSQLWAGYLGTPISFGCVVLGVDEAQLLYDWVNLGTPVEIQW